MQKLQLPHVILPEEFITLLKANLPTVSTPAPVFDVIRPNRALYYTLEKAFQEFNDGRGPEKTMIALGWPSFRERMASLFIYKSIYGNYPIKTDMDLVEDIRQLESKFLNHSVNSYSRVFLLGFYLRMASIHLQKRENNKFLEINVPEEIAVMLNLSQGRSQKIDWLILILMHFNYGLGDKLLLSYLVSGKKFEDLYSLLTPDFRKTMMENLLAYGLSIGEPEHFLYEKV